MRRNVVLFALCFVAVGTASLVPADADAAEFTDLLDAADDFDDYKEKTYDPFDFNIEPSFRYDLTNAKITREAPCVPVTQDNLAGSEYAGGPAVVNNPRIVTDPSRCSESEIVYNKEMLYRHTRSQIDLTLRAGIYKDLEFHLTVPYVFSSTHGLKYANEDPSGEDVTEANSSVDPSTSRIQSNADAAFDQGGSYEDNIRNFDRFTLYRFFDLEEDYKQYRRSGFADPSFGFHWAPFNDQRDDTKATLLIGADYQIPIAPIKEADDDDVGEGMHELHFKLASSKQFDWIDPYFGLEYFLPIAAGNSPIKEYDTNNSGQVFTNPPQRGEVTIGTEFIPYENEETGERYAIDLRFVMGYVSEGLDYTPLYDHLVNSECNGKKVTDVTPEFDSNGNVSNPDEVACGWVIQRPANTRETGNLIYDPAQMNQEQRNLARFSTDGIMTVEDHGTFSGQLGFHLQPTEYFQLKAIARLKHRQEHFLTNSRTGKDLDSGEATPDDTVDLTGDDAKFERNPIYNPTYDSAGQRFRIEEYNSWTFLVNAALQF